VGPIIFSSHGIGDHRLTFSSSHEKIMEIECDLLTSNFRDPKTIALVREKIGHIFDGSLSHCGGSLKLGLSKAFDIKKQKKTSAQLRCGYAHCAWHQNPVSYSSIGSNTYCPNCGQRYYMQCTGCGCDRNGNYASCQRCRRNFV